MTYYIYQYSTENGSGEYVIISEDSPAEFDTELNRRPDYQFIKSFKIESDEFLTTLPLDYVLEKF